MTPLARGRRPGSVAALLAALLTVTLAACGDDGPDVDEARLDVEGLATVVDAEGATEQVTGTETLSFGDTVRLEEGTATLELAAGQRYELRAGEPGTELLVGAPPTLLAGDVLVTDGFPASIAHETTTLVAQGALKVSSGVPTATAYAGRTRISGAGGLTEVLGLRQVVLTPSAVPEPLEYDAADPWDRRYLGDAVALGQRLEAFARGFTGDRGAAAARSASFYEAVLPALADEREFGADLVGDRPAGETLVGAAIAVQGREGTFRGRWEEIFAFRDAGAAWGLVALDQGVSSTPVLQSIELAVAGPAPPVADRATSTTTGRPGTTTTAPDRTSTTVTTTTTTTTVPPGESGALDPVLTPVGDLLGDVLRALGLG